jgi:hypothetical protein
VTLLGVGILRSSEEGGVLRVKWSIGESGSQGLLALGWRRKKLGFFSTDVVDV